MKKIPEYYTLLILLLLSWVVSAQDETQFINGRLLDGNTKEPIAFATVRAENKALGVISNADGSFRIPIAFKEFSDTLIISCLGFENKQLDLSVLQPNPVVNIIYLNEERQQLKEVVVASERKSRPKLSEQDILKNAIQRIPLNYPSSSFSLVGYYRDYQIRRNAYLNLNEAVIEVFDRGFAFDDYRTTKTLLYDYEANHVFKRDTATSKPYDFINKSKIIKNAYLTSQGGNEFTILRVHDAIRNYNKHTYSYIYILQENFIDEHIFARESDTFINGEPLYVLTISKVEPKTLVRGRIYISKNNFAIHKLEYGVYSRKEFLSRDQERKEKAVNSGIKSEGLGPLIFNVNVEYQKKEDFMYLNYISFTNKFQVTLPSEFQLITKKIDFEKQELELTFNHSPKISSALNKKKYKLFYKGKPLKVTSVKVKDKKVFLHISEINGLLQTGGGNTAQLVNLSLEIKNIKDVYGNVFNRYKKYALKQFREFFVQEINPLKKASLDGRFISKTVPMFKGFENDIPLENLKKYWMNTPLKTKGN